MALNLDDLIGSMQHSCNAGDRGDDIQTMRESLRASLGNQALGPPNHNNQFNNRQQQNPSVYQTSQSQRRGGNNSSNGGPSRGGWNSNELSSSFGRSTNGIQVPSTTPTSTQFFSSGSMEKGRNQFNGGSSSSSSNNNNNRTLGGNPSSMTFSDSSSSNNSHSSFGTGNLQAPTNTPLQTPVENGGLENRYYAANGEQRQGNGNGGDEDMNQDDDEQRYSYQNQNFNQNDSGGTFTRRVVGGFDGGFNNNASPPTNGYEIPPQNA